MAQKIRVLDALPADLGFNIQHLHAGSQQQTVSSLLGDSVSSSGLHGYCMVMMHRCTNKQRPIHIKITMKLGAQNYFLKSVLY